MKTMLKRLMIVFIGISGILAAAGLFLMDSTLSDLLNPVLIDEAPLIPDDLKTIPMKILIKNEEGSVHGLYMDVPDSDFIVLYCHDCNGNLFDRLEMMRRFKELGLSVFAVDYRGFGLSDHVEISDETFREDLKKIYDALRRKRWSASQIIIYGQGISVGIQGDLLASVQCAAWVMDNPIPALQDSTSNSIRRFLTVDRLSAYPALATFQGPVLVCYDDTMISSDTLARLHTIRASIDMCAVRGGRTRDRMDDVDWPAWRACMDVLIDGLAKTERPVAPMPLKPADKVTDNVAEKATEKAHE
ncbi:hypothetical protein JXA80_02630 [bacterium]|nr:hypothetical protein [candidate division CSSED10-310 bacterium]